MSPNANERIKGKNFAHFRNDLHCIICEGITLCERDRWGTLENGWGGRGTVYRLSLGVSLGWTRIQLRKKMRERFQKFVI